MGIFLSCNCLSSCTYLHLFLKLLLFVGLQQLGFAEFERVMKSQIKLYVQRELSNTLIAGAGTRFEVWSMCACGLFWSTSLTTWFLSCPSADLTTYTTNLLDLCHNSLRLLDFPGGTAINNEGTFSWKYNCAGMKYKHSSPIKLFQLVRLSTKEREKF